MGIFDKRVALEPQEYPEVNQYVDAINHSYWIVTEVNFEADIQDFHVKLSPLERNVVKNTLLAISQIEVSVKTFWGKLYDHFPKPEFGDVGATFAESEVRHQKAYSHLLKILGLKGDFDELVKVPAIQGRIEYLSASLRTSNSQNQQTYTTALTLFSLFIENVSLFSQFAIVKSFYKKKQVLKDIDNIIQATQKEEMLHALMGIYIINQIKTEYPEWFNEDFYQQIEEASKKAYQAEANILNWIFEQGELDFLPIETLQEFIKYRFNESIKMIGGKEPFEVDHEKLSGLKWFIEEMYLEVQYDFFHKRSNAYSKKMQSITAKDLF